MNAKLCKRLRGLARARSKGLPARGYVGIYGRGKYKATVVAIGNHPQTTRGVYRALKREAGAA